jgi:hypothetical protein
MFGQNQAECCSGDQGDCLATSAIAAGALPHPTSAADVESEPGD